MEKCSNVYFKKISSKKSIFRSKFQTLTLLCGIEPVLYGVGVLAEICSPTKLEVRSINLCLWIPSPGPIWLMWLKFVGADINLDLLSVLLKKRGKINKRLLTSKNAVFKWMKIFIWKSIIQFTKFTYIRCDLLPSLSENRLLVFCMVLPSLSTVTMLSKLSNSPETLRTIF